MPDAPIAAMLLAAGRGERMRPLTDATPKPLLAVHGKQLMQWPLEALARGGFGPAVVNTAWLGEQIAQAFGSIFELQPPSNGLEQLSIQEQPQHTIAIQYSHEGRDFGGALETAGGIVRALPLLGDIFWVLAGDVFAPDFAFDPLAVRRFAASGQLAHLWLVPNPVHNPRGDFGWESLPVAATTATVGDVDTDTPSGLALNLDASDPRPRYTYSTMGLFRKALFEPPWCDIPAGNPQGVKAALAPLLRAAMDQGRISAELYTGRWTDVGTPQRLEQLNAAR